MARGLPPAEVRAWAETLSDDEAAALLYDWAFWARPDQLMPAGDWSGWLALAGRGWGKTRVGAEAVRIWARRFRFVNLVAATADDARDIMVEGESGILAVCPPDERPFYRSSKSRLEWPNGSRSLIFTADEPERLRGKQHQKLWCFIAGTLVDTPKGKVPIETLCEGDAVITRFGIRRVLACVSHMALVGCVTFANGAELTGTGEHPVLTLNGWTRLDNLSVGQSALTATSAPTSGSQGNAASGAMYTSTDGYGNRPTALFRRARKFITATATRLTTRLKIWSASLTSSTAQFTPQLENNAGSAKSSTLQNAWFAVARSRSSIEAQRQNACAAISAKPIQSVRRRSEPADIAERYSSRDSAHSAVSVASTWEPVGEREVFNLTVEGEHEFIANGIVVHNCDEIAAWRYPEAWDQAMMGLRLGPNPQVVATTTPRPTALIKELLASPGWVVSRGTTYDNRPNLAPKFFAKVISKYEGTRLGRQELNAEVLDDNPRALWHRAQIDKCRVKDAPQLHRIVVGLDPNVKNRDHAALAKSSDVLDEAGIVIAGIGDAPSDWKGVAGPHFYVLGDCSLDEGPNVWGMAAVKAYRDYSADRVIGEVNNGGDMVEMTLRAVDANVSYKSVTATRGKAVRAEPIAALYEQGRVHHVGSFAKLEDEQCDFDPVLQSLPGSKSPNRMDALVWALTELSADESTGMLDFMRAQAAAVPAAAPKYPTPTIVEGWPT